MRLYLPVLFFAAFFSFSAQADSVVIGGSCDTIGASRMTSDQQNIVVCLKNTSSALVWKSSTSGSGSGSICGFAVNGSVGAQCEGVNFLSKGCPSGYTLAQQGMATAVAIQDSSGQNVYPATLTLAYCSKSGT